MSISESGTIPSCFSLLVTSFIMSVIAKSFQGKSSLKEYDCAIRCKKIAYLLCFQYPDSVLRNPVLPSQSSQKCASHIGLYKLMSSEEQTH